MTSHLHPNTTQVPNIVLDFWMQDLSKAQMRVLFYIIRRTYGFHRDRDQISKSQMLNGLRRKSDGSILDRGTGLPESSLLPALKELVQRGMIVEEKVINDGGNQPTWYRLDLNWIPDQKGKPESDPPSPENWGNPPPHRSGGTPSPENWGKQNKVPGNQVLGTPRPAGFSAEKPSDLVPQTSLAALVPSSEGEVKNDQLSIFDSSAQGNVFRGGSGENDSRVRAVVSADALRSAASRANQAVFEKAQREKAKLEKRQQDGEWKREKIARFADLLNEAGVKTRFGQRDRDTIYEWEDDDLGALAEAYVSAFKGTWKNEFVQRNMSVYFVANNIGAYEKWKHDGSPDDPHKFKFPTSEATRTFARKWDEETRARHYADVHNVTIEEYWQARADGKYLDEKLSD